MRIFHFFFFFTFFFSFCFFIVFSRPAVDGKAHRETSELVLRHDHHRVSQRRDRSAEAESEGDGRKPVSSEVLQEDLQVILLCSVALIDQTTDTYYPICVIRPTKIVEESVLVGAIDSLLF